MRVIVCGGRDYSDREKVNEVLTKEIGLQGHPDTPRDRVIVGEATGADTLAYQWADRAGCSVYRYRANWEKEGKAAGPIRNQKMLDEEKPNLVIAFPGGRGTADMVRRAKAAGVRVIEV